MSFELMLSMFGGNVFVCVCLSQSGGIRVDGRKLNIVAAISREDAVKLKDKKVKTHTGTRNLYLAREGCKLHLLLLPFLLPYPPSHTSFFQ